MFRLIFRTSFKRTFLLVAVTSVFISTQGSTARGDELKKAISLVMAANTTAARSQDRIDKLDDETASLLARYTETQRQIESLRVYNEQVDKLVTTQKERMEDLQRQINDAAMISREIAPLMLRMLDSLEKFVSLDVPFLLDERKKRLAELRTLMNQADVFDSEKYRRVLEAYQIENEYGRTIEPYRAKLKLDGAEKTVDFLRIGRVVLVYRTIDASEIGVWDQASRKWQKLSNDQISAINKGFRIAKKQSAPDLIELPVTAAKDNR